MGVAIWGLYTGINESIIPAAVALMVPVERRASAYGLFTAGYGIFWFLGSALIGVLYGVLYGVSLPLVVIFCMITEFAAIPLLLKVRREINR